MAYTSSDRTEPADHYLRDDDRVPASPAGSDRLTEKRLCTLARYRVLDSAAEEAFDEIAFIASQVCATPVALVSLVEEDRQWFKARIGFEACETPISQSVCRHGMERDALLVIDDLSSDPRTAGNTLVTGDPRIRFYAGAPLVVPDGTIIGMLCVIDTAPRPGGLSPEQRRMLKSLAKQVVGQLERRREVLDAERDTQIVRRAAERMRLAEEAGRVGAFEMDIATGTVTMSREFRRIYGLDDLSVVDAAALSAMQAGDAPAFESADVELATGDVQDARFDEYEIEQPGGARRWLQRRAALVPDGKGGRGQLLGVVTDVTEQRAINEEMSHRLKNSLALVQAIASHTLRGVADTGAVTEFNRRIAALSSAHDILLSRTHAAGSLQAVVDGVLSRLGLENRVAWSGEDFDLASRPTLLLSMLMHELATNAMKYGSLSVDGGHAAIVSHVETNDEGEQLVITWQEIGGPPAVEPTRKGLGMRLVQSGLHPAGTSRVEFADDGMKVRFAAPVSQVAA